MSGSGEGRFLDALRAVRDGLEQLDLPWVIIGGVAVIARGVPRFTADIDATVWVGTIDPERILDVLGRQQLAPRIEHAAAFARQHQVLLLRHTPSGVPLDVSLAALPFEHEAIQSGQECDYAGVRIRVARAEDLVVYKLVAARPRDLDDAEKLLSLHGSTLDIARIRRLVREFSDALEDSSRVDTFERLLRKTGLER